MRKFRGNMRKLILWTMLFLGLKVHSQTLPSVVSIKTPEVTAFNRNIETPVSLYTGVPSISIPLYEIKLKGKTIPITLNYQSGGIRVDQEATWVGLGWTLSYGGEVSRKVRGTPDEKYFIKAVNVNGATINDFNQLPQISSDPYLNERCEKVYQAKQGNNDYMPDEFYYSVAGFSGKFLFSQEHNKFLLFPKEDIDIQQAADGSNTPLYKFNVKLPDGTTVDFGETAYSSQVDIPKTSDNTKNAWYIKKITTSFNEAIEYSYSSFNYNIRKLATSTFSGPTPESPSTTLSNDFRQYSYNDAQPSQIAFPGGVVTFVTGPRQDMATPRLYRIEVSDQQGNITQTIEFNFSYFYGDNYDILPVLSLGSYVNTDYRYKRLRLDGLTIKGSDGRTKNYNFDYYSDNGTYPCKYSFAQDHWGFYNGINNMGSAMFIPNMVPSKFNGGDRRVKPDKSNVFSLKSVAYPEGGKTEFVYESNSAMTNSSMPAYLLEQYQDDNIQDKFASIYVSSYSRSTSYPSPDYTDPNGHRFFKKQFTVAVNAMMPMAWGWNCSSNFGISQAEQYDPFFVNNVTYKLERINLNGTRTTVASWNNTETNSPYTRTQANLSDQIRLSPGDYEISVELVYLNQPGSVSDMQPYNLSFIVNWRELNNASKMLYTGGVRVKDINLYTKDGVLAKKKHFNYTDPTNPSAPTSGRLISLPDYFQYTYQDIAPQPPNPGGSHFSYTFSANSVHPLESTSGSACGYEYVDEIDVDYNNAANNMKTAYKFSFNLPYYNAYNPYMNAAGWEPAEWTRGKLQSKKIYKENNILQQEDYTYYDWSPHVQNGNNEDYVQEINTDLISYQYLRRISPLCATAPKDFYYIDPNSTVFGSVSCIQWYYGAANHAMILPSGTSAYCPQNIVLPYIQRFTAFDKLKTRTITTKDENGNSITSTENLYYDKTPSLHQVTRSESINSENQLIKSENKYPIDQPLASPYSTMLQRHMLSNVIEQSVYKNSVFQNSSKTNYYDWGNNIIAPSIIEGKLTTNTPEVKMRFYAYDDKGNPLSVSKENDVKVAYLWDYNQQYTVAEVVNAEPDDIAFTSFETSNKGGFTYSGSTLSGSVWAPTGKVCYTLSSGSITKSVNIAKSYTVSLWGTGGVLVNGSGPTKTGRSVNGWTYYEYLVSNSTQISVSGSGNVDEVRLYPSTALMTTYCYRQLIGLTSVCDPNSRISYYEYDGLNRLALIRDMDNNILKKICYNYAGQPVDCSSPCTNMTANWQNTSTPPRCQQSSPCIYTGYQEQEQKDINPCSPTYNELQWVTGAYNPLSCPAGTNVQLTYQNSFYPGFTATYTNALTGAVFTFPVPATGSGFLGCLPAGTYYVNIAKPGNTTVFLFGLGCRSISGTSAGTKITVSATACNQVSISLVDGE